MNLRLINYDENLQSLHLYREEVTLNESPETNLSRSSFHGIRKHMHSYSFLWCSYSFPRVDMDFSGIRRYLQKTKK